MSKKEEMNLTGIFISKEGDQIAVLLEERFVDGNGSERSRFMFSGVKHFQNMYCALQYVESLGTTLID